MLGRRASTHTSLPVLTAGSALLAAVRLAGSLSDNASAADDWSAAPIVLAITSAFALSSRSGRDADDPIAPLGRLFEALRPGLGVNAVLGGVLKELLGLSGAQEAVVLLENRHTGRLFQVALTADHADDQVKVRRVGRSVRPTYFFPWPADFSSGRVPFPAPSDTDLRVIEIERGHGFVPQAFRTMHAFRRLYAVAFGCGTEWQGRLFLLDPAPAHAGRNFIATFEQMLRHLLPAVAGVCDLHSVKRRAAAQERARLARELHDGVVQSLVSLDLELELLRRTPVERWTAAPEQLHGMQEQLRTQVRELRALMQHARGQDVEAARLPAVLAEIVQRFGRETGMIVNCVSEVSDLRLPARVCGEIVRIVQEALVNVKRHSGARHVDVRLLDDEDDLKLHVQDDGRGFPISWAAPAGTNVLVTPPAIIDDRVRSIGGRVHITSAGRGTGLEITLPRRGPWATAKLSA
jgi:signal transduction histidine kinase